MMTTGTTDGSAAVTVEVKENGHQHSNGDSEDSKANESSNVHTTPKDDKLEDPEEMDALAEESRPPVENGRTSPESAPAPVAAPAPAEPVPQPAPAPAPVQSAAPQSTTPGGGTAAAAVAATPAPTGRKRSGESAEDGAAAAKKPRPEPNERATPLTPDIACLRTVELIESSLHKLKREVKAIDLLARQKEKEWDNLLKLRKAKEETFQRLRRKREVLLMQQSDEAASLAQRVAAGPASGGSGSGSVSVPTPSPGVSAASLVQQQLQQHKKQQAQRAAVAAAAAALSAQSSHGLRPIRPAYGTAGGRLGQGMGPQGPTISVQHLIDRHAADYRRRSDLAVPLPPSGSPAGQQDPQYREMLAQIAKLSKAPSAAAAAAAAAVASVAGGTGEVTIHQVSGPSSGGDSQPQSSLAKLLMESKLKQAEPTSVVSEMLKRRPTVPLSGGMMQSSQAQLTIRSPAPRIQAPQAAPPPPPPPPAAEEVPLCQGCQQRQAQFVCAGCGHQWYCSRECQVEAWDSHADDCSG